MLNSIKPRHVVIAAALPLPLDGISELHRVVERLYGAGESMLNFDEAGFVRITAPNAGFGPLKRPKKRAEPLIPAEDITLLRDITIDGETLEASFEDAQERVLILSAALAQFFAFSGGINYVTAQVLSAGDDTAQYHVTVQKTGNPTAHELRGIAEARVAELEAELAEVRQESMAKEARPGTATATKELVDEGLFSSQTETLPDLSEPWDMRDHARDLNRLFDETGYGAGAQLSDGLGRRVPRRKNI